MSISLDDGFPYYANRALKKNSGQDRQSEKKKQHEDSEFFQIQFLVIPFAVFTFPRIEKACTWQIKGDNSTKYEASSSQISPFP